VVGAGGGLFLYFALLKSWVHFSFCIQELGPEVAGGSVIIVGIRSHKQNVLSFTQDGIPISFSQYSHIYKIYCFIFGCE